MAYRMERLEAEDGGPWTHIVKRAPPHVVEGEEHHKAKLTAASVLAIRATSLAIPARELASRFGVSKSTIKRIRRGEGWASVS